MSHLGISCLDLKSPWEMNSKYKHAWYWFSNSWNSLWKAKEDVVNTKNDFVFIKAMSAYWMLTKTCFYHLSSCGEPVEQKKGNELHY